jgi:hypothetical protein
MFVWRHTCDFLASAKRYDFIKKKQFFSAAPSIKGNYL